MTDFIDEVSDIIPADEEQGMFEHFRFVADKGQEPVRVDKYMASHMEDTAAILCESIKDSNVDYFVYVELMPENRQWHCESCFPILRNFFCKIV